MGGDQLPRRQKATLTGRRDRLHLPERHRRSTDQRFQHGRGLRQGGVRRAAQPEARGVVRRGQDQRRVLRGQRHATRSRWARRTRSRSAPWPGSARARTPTSTRTATRRRNSSTSSDDGFTHLRPVRRRSAHGGPVLDHARVCTSSSTETTSPRSPRRTSTDKDVKFWGGVTISWSKALRRGGGGGDHRVAAPVRARHPERSEGGMPRRHAPFASLRVTAGRVRHAPTTAPAPPP